jgi:glutamate-1-semialdehyde 2,1-aminomutase
VACIDYRTARHNDAESGAIYNSVLRTHGILKAPSKVYPSLTITDADIDKTKTAAIAAVAAVASYRQDGSA